MTAERREARRELVGQVAERGAVGELPVARGGAEGVGGGGEGEDADSHRRRS